MKKIKYKHEKCSEIHTPIAGENRTNYSQDVKCFKKKKNNTKMQY